MTILRNEIEIKVDKQERIRNFAIRQNSKTSLSKRIDDWKLRKKLQDEQNHRHKLLLSLKWDFLKDIKRNLYEQNV